MAKNLNKTIVIYHNDVNKLNLSLLSPLEHNLLFSIFRYLNLNSLYSFSTDDLIFMAYDNSTPFDVYKARERIPNLVESLAKKFLGVNFQIIAKTHTTFVNLFSYMKINYDDKGSLVSLDIALNKDLEWILKGLRKTFTAVDLVKFKGLSSIYTKCIFRLLSQYNQTGFLSLTWENFKNVLGIPDTYKTANIKQRVLEPTIKELSPFYKSISYSLIRKHNKVETIHFQWTLKAKEIKQEAKEKSLLINADIKRIDATKKGLNESLTYAKALGDDSKASVIQNAITSLNNLKSMV